MNWNWLHEFQHVAWIVTQARWASTSCLFSTNEEPHCLLHTRWFTGSSIVLWKNLWTISMNERGFKLACSLFSVCLLILTEVSSTSQVPSPWTQHFYEGKTYYYNQQTGSTTTNMSAMMWLTLHCFHVTIKTHLSCTIHRYYSVGDT